MSLLKQVKSRPTKSPVQCPLGEAPLRSFWNFNLLGCYIFALGQKNGKSKFFEIGPHLPTVPGGFLNRVSQNILISIEIESLVPDMYCWYSYLVHFREEDINDVESCIRVTLNFLNFL